MDQGHHHVGTGLSICTLEQKTAVTCSLDPTILRAGAGSGKTFVLTKRVLWLMKEKNISPERILVVSFTKKAAKHARKKLKELGLFEVDSEEGGLQVSTIHKFCMNFLTDCKQIDWNGRKRIIDDWDIEDLYEEIIQYMDLGHGRIGPIGFLSELLQYCRDRIKSGDDSGQAINKGGHIHGLPCH